MCYQLSLLSWLRLHREFDGNKQQASELLAILVQGSAKNQKKWVYEASAFVM